jgi:hypothetical protein
MTPGLSPADDSSYTNTIRHALRALLGRDGSIPFRPSSYKAVFDAVETAVSLAGKGPEVYAMLGRELDRACAEGVARRLADGQGMPWLENLVGEWKWFEGRVVKSLLGLQTSTALRQPITELAACSSDLARPRVYL